MDVKNKTEPNGGLTDEEYRRDCEIRHFLRVLAHDEFWSWVESRRKKVPHIYTRSIELMVETQAGADIKKRLEVASDKYRAEYRESLVNAWRQSRREAQ